MTAAAVPTAVPTGASVSRARPFHGLRPPRGRTAIDGHLHRFERPQALSASQHLQVFRRAALRQRCDGQAAFDGGDLPRQAGTVVDDLVGAPLRRQRVDRAATTQAGFFVHGDGQRVATPHVELLRADPDHGLVEQQGAAPGVVARDQGEVELASGHSRDQRGRLLAVQLDLDPSMPGCESPEHGRQVLARVVVGNAQPHQARDGLAVQGCLCLGVEVQHASRIAQQRLPFVRELKLSRSADQELAPGSRLQLLQLHADRGLRPMKLGCGAGERAGIDRCDEAFQPVDLQVMHGI